MQTYRFCINFWRRYDELQPPEGVLYTASRHTRVSPEHPQASSQKGDLPGGVAGSTNPTSETPEGFGGFCADNDILYQFSVKMGRITTSGGCITHAPPQQTRPRGSPRPVASKGSIPERLRGAYSPAQGREQVSTANQVLYQFLYQFSRRPHREIDRTSSKNNFAR